MKKTISLFLSLLFILCLASCGGSEKENAVSGNAQTESVVSIKEEGETPSQTASVVSNESKKTDTQSKTASKTTSKTSEKKKTYANVSGYPKTNGKYTHHKLFVNGKALSLDAVTIGSSNTVFVPALCLTYSLDGDGTACSSEKNGVLTCAAFTACFNGKVVVNHIKSNITIIDNKSYNDTAPFRYEGGEYDGEYFSSTLFLEKAISATVNFSPDRSAVYIDTAKVDEKKSHAYELMLESSGSLTVKDKSSGKVVLTVNGKDMPDNGGSGSGSGSGTSSKTSSTTSRGLQRARCTGCGGTGTVTRQELVWDPVGGGLRPQMKISVCPTCGGSGYNGYE